MINIQIAGKNEASLIADISRETFNDTFAAFNTPADMEKFLSHQFSKEELMSQVGTSGNIFFLAFIGEEPAGYLYLKEVSHPDLTDTNAIEISRLYSRKNFIGKGIGPALMKAAFDYALQKQKTTVWLGVWEHNHRAIRFYQKFGFEKFSEHDFLLGDDVQKDWVMGRKLVAEER